MISKLTQQSHNPPGNSSKKLRPDYSYAAIIAAFLCVAGLLFVALTVLWLGQTSQRVSQQGAEALTIRAVLRADTDDVTAELLAVEIRGHVPEVTIEVINEAMGRSLLALQEPWIAEMPDFEVTPLPILLEIQHPKLLTNPEEVARFVEDLEKNPAVDFVAYNETAHNRLSKYASASRQIEKHAVRWMLAAIALVALAALFACSRLAGKLSFMGEVISAVTVWITAWGAAWFTYRQWESTAITSGDWQRIDLKTHIIVGTFALLLIMAARVLNMAVFRRRR